MAEMENGLITRDKKAPSSTPRQSVEYTQAKAWTPSPGDRPMYDGADMATTDLPEENFPPEPQAQPPDVSKLTRIQGYENVGFYPNTSGPPITPPHDEQVKTPVAPNRDSEQYLSIEHLSEDQAREALLDHVADKCCYGNAAGNEMVLEKISPSSALHLDGAAPKCANCNCGVDFDKCSISWRPSRKPAVLPGNKSPTKLALLHAPLMQKAGDGRARVDWCFLSPEGQPVDGPSNGAAPLPWDIECQSSCPFTNEIHHLEVPHTSTIISCHGCRGQGWIRCYSCLGRGFKRCVQCHGSGRDWKTDAHGHRHVESCWHCHGTGRKRCLSCSGDGRVVCRTCQGYRQLKCYIRLSVTYANHVAEVLVERTDLPSKLLKHVGGLTIFQQTASRVCPLMYHPDAELCEASQRLVTEHCARFPRSRIVNQRQQLREIPVTECAFSWKNKKSAFWVYGNETKVHVPHYPQRYCYGCIVL